MKRVLKWSGIAALLLIFVTAAPILFVETSCRGQQEPQKNATYITDPLDQRPEARTLLTYPEWHIVYIYEGYAQALTKGPPHTFPYLASIIDFWKSLCVLTEKADTLGNAGFNSKATIYTIGVSFTLEMAAKALYEETFGRIASLTSSGAHDQIEREMAHKYADFLQQTPWYKFNFSLWNAKLWATPAKSLRDWERRIALTTEWKVKSVYAGLIAKAVADIGQDELTMLIAHTGDVLGQSQTSDEAGVLISEVPRYRVFTKIAEEIAFSGHDILEIAGNDDILVTVIATDIPNIPSSAQVIYQTRRPGFKDRRLLILIKVNQLAQLIRTLNLHGQSLEHVYDY